MSFVDVGRDIDSFLEAPCSIIVMGEPGVGKTCSIARAKGTENCLWVVSSRKELRGYASYLKMKRLEAEKLKAEGKDIPPALEAEANRELPKKILEVSEFTKNDKGETVRISNEQMVTAIVEAYKKRLAAEPDYYSGIVFSVWSILAKRIHDDMTIRIGDKGWDVGREIHQLHRWLMREVPQTTNKTLILDCHKREPDFDKSGALKTMGGPLLPTGPLGKPVAGEADFIFELKKEMVETGDKLDGTWKQEERRVWLTESDEYTIRKRRDFRIKPVEDGSLEEVLAKADVVIK